MSVIPGENYGVSAHKARLAIANHSAIVNSLRVVNLVRVLFLVRWGPLGWPKLGTKKNQ